MRLLILIFCSILYLQGNASAKPALTFSNGTWVGNGGLAVRCSSDPAVKPILLDLAEGTMKAEDWFFPEGGTLMNKVASLVARVREFSPERTALYERLARDFKSHMRFVELVSHTKDVGPVQISEDCKILQAVVQFQAFPRTYSTPEDYLHFADQTLWPVYYMDAILWPQLTEDMKSALILHEIVYREASLLGHKGNSSYVRKYVRAIVEDRFKDMNAAQYLEFMTSNYLAIHFWNDSQAKRRWMLTPRLNRSFFMADLGCSAYEGFKVPSSQEFTEAASRLFASQDAKALALDDPDLTFWVEGDSPFSPKIMNYQGSEVGTYSLKSLGVGLCISK